MSSRCGNFCIVHSINILYLVCGSLIARCIVSVCCWISSSFSFIYSMAKVIDPTGVPSRRNPCVNSTGVGWRGSVILSLLE